MFGKGKRRQVLVDRKAQVGLSLLIVLYLMVYSLISLGIMVAPSALRFLQPQLPIEERFLASQEFLYLEQWVVPVQAIMSVALAVHFIFISNRIFGPLHRFRATLADWGEGRWPKAFLGRRNDFHVNLFATFNDTAARLREDVLQTRGHLSTALEAASAIPRDRLPNDTAMRLREIEDECRQAVRRLERFDVPPADGR